MYTTTYERAQQYKGTYTESNSQNSHSQKHKEVSISLQTPFFFAMRSCEYLSVSQAEKRRTDIIRLRNIRFFRAGVEMSHNNPSLTSADSVSITFEWQKKDERSETVTLTFQPIIPFSPLQNSGQPLSDESEVTIAPTMILLYLPSGGILIESNTYHPRK